MYGTCSYQDLNLGPPACRAGALDRTELQELGDAACVRGGGKIRTSDLRLMRTTGYQAALPRDDAVLQLYHVPPGGFEPTTVRIKSTEPVHSGADGMVPLPGFEPGTPSLEGSAVHPARRASCASYGTRTRARRALEAPALATELTRQAPRPRTRTGHP